MMIYGIRVPGSLHFTRKLEQDPTKSVLVLGTHPFGATDPRDTLRLVQSVIGFSGWWMVGCL